jgi:translocation and assembly module TamA
MNFSRTRAAAPVLAALAAFATLGLGGCATISETVGGWFGGDLRGAPRAAADIEDTTPPLPPAVAVSIDAPAPLKLLLERNLDLTRLPLLSRGDTVSALEWARLIDAAPAQVKDLLQTEGYFAPVVTVQRGPVSLRQAAPQEVRLTVDPGLRARISRVTLVFEGALHEDAESGDRLAASLRSELQRNWSLPARAEFRNSQWSDAKASLLARLRAAGYASAAWAGTAAEVDVGVGVQGAQVRLFLVADSGPLFRAGEIEVEGLEVHEASTVRHLAAFSTGTPLTELLLLDYQERLQKSNLFESVNVSHDTDPARAAAARITVRLREQPLQVYTIGLGYSNNTGPRVTFEQIDRRVFGQPLRSRAALELAGLKRKLDLELSTHPGEGLNRNVAGVIIERLETSSDAVTSQRVRLGRAWDSQTFERLAFAEAERGLRTTATSRRESNALSLNIHLVLRRLDSAVLPTEGYTLALQGGIGRSHGNLDRAGLFGRAYARFTGYLPLGASWYAQGRLEAGQLIRRDGVGAPDSQLFRAGGDDSVRGYAYRDLGPIVDGSVTSGGVLGTASLELARPFSAEMPSLWGAVFVDAGTAATSFAAFSPVVGTGFGIRWRSPVGPLRLDLARAIDDRRWRLHFSIGVAL